MDQMLRGTFDPNSGFATQGDDTKVMVTFYIKPELDGEKSREQKRSIYRDVTYVKMVQPGEARLSSIDRPVKEEDILRFPRQWEAFQRGKPAEVIGAPLSLLFPMNPSLVENLRHYGVHTIEQLAGLNDTALQELGMGGRQFQTQAKAYLAKATDGKEYHAVVERTEALELKNQELAAKVTALEAALTAATTEPEKRGPGRPRKQEAEAA